MHTLKWYVASLSLLKFPTPSHLDLLAKQSLSIHLLIDLYVAREDTLRSHHVPPNISIPRFEICLNINDDALTSG